MQSDFNVGFGGNDHIILELKRFIDLTSRQIILRMLYDLVEFSITNMCCSGLNGGSNSFMISNSV